MSTPTENQNQNVRGLITNLKVSENTSDTLGQVWLFKIFHYSFSWSNSVHSEIQSKSTLPKAEQKLMKPHENKTQRDSNNWYVFHYDWNVPMTWIFFIVK